MMTLKQDLKQMHVDELRSYAELLEQEIEKLNEELETAKVNEGAYSIGRSDIRYFLSTILGIEEEYVSSELVEDAFNKIKGKFTLEGESDTFIAYIKSTLDVKNLHNVYSGMLSDDGSTLHIYFHDEPGMDTPDATFTGDAVNGLLKKVFGENYETDAVDDTFTFTFDRSLLGE
ncbi:DUF1192 family protein [Exiguobacterium sp. s163]|uniref:DUF1192 family protein n=1 Tax=Exiguobacterium sp. s163 TaxID=2751287 RepID=UPI001BE5CB24|nr:DUF1192 family protein [Exiguobacterium sp. s163]